MGFNSGFKGLNTESQKATKKTINKEKCNPHADVFVNSTYCNTNMKIFRQILDEAIFRLQNH